MISCRALDRASLPSTSLRSRVPTPFPWAAGETAIQYRSQVPRVQGVGPTTVKTEQLPARGEGAHGGVVLPGMGKTRVKHFQSHGDLVFAKHVRCPEDGFRGSALLWSKGVHNEKCVRGWRPRFGCGCGHVRTADLSKAPAMIRSTRVG